MENTGWAVPAYPKTSCCFVYHGYAPASQEESCSRGSKLITLVQQHQQQKYGLTNKQMSIFYYWDSKWFKLTSIEDPVFGCFLHISIARD